MFFHSYSNFLLNKLPFLELNAVSVVEIPWLTVICVAESFQIYPTQTNYETIVPFELCNYFSILI